MTKMVALHGGIGVVVIKVDNGDEDEIMMIDYGWYHHYLIRVFGSDSYCCIEGGCCHQICHDDINNCYIDRGDNDDNNCDNNNE